MLPKNVVKDFSRQSLADLEQYLLDRWSDQATFLAQADTDFIDGVVRYIGETLNQGRWRWLADQREAPGHRDITEQYVAYLAPPGSAAGMGRP